jgi:hypothetical protein
MTLMVVAARTSETSVNFYKTTQHNNPDDKKTAIFLLFLCSSFCAHCVIGFGFFFCE